MNDRIANLRRFLVYLLVWGPIFFSAQRGGIAAAGAQEPPEHERIHESVIAGAWYPGSAEALRQQVKGFLDGVPDISFPGHLTTLVSPHAGYPFSGQVAAYSYKLLEKQKFTTVIIIGPSHFVRFSGVAVYDRGGFRTPLGVVPLDHELISALEKREPRIRFVPGAHTREHSIEMQLPFLQTIMPGFKLVPLLIGEQDLATCQWLARAISAAIKDKSVLVVASSDLSHFRSYDEARRLDRVVMDKVSAFDPKGLSESLEKGECAACGGGAIVTAMLVAKDLGATYAKVLHAANSGDVTGDRDRVVGYIAAALGIVKEIPSGDKADAPTAAMDMGLSSADKALLLRIARETIEARCRGEKRPELGTTSPRLKEGGGAFVTLRRKGELRGCIGRISAHEPLVRTVAEMAEAAAFNDPRFGPVGPDELKDLKIEISVLTPLKKIDRPEAIRVGTHGIYIRNGWRSGLLLPQVATEFGWDRTTFLEHTCRKAGLPKDAWKDKSSQIYIFSAEVF
jgi:MEMO1 family protein